MYHVTYLAYSEELDKYYIGSKSFKSFKIWQEYRTSSKYPRFSDTLSWKQILTYHNNREESFTSEEHLQKFFNVTKNERFANIRVIPKFTSSGTSRSKEAIRKTAQANKGRPRPDLIQRNVDSRDSTIYLWEHKDGRQEESTQYAMRIKYSMDSGNVSKIIRRERIRHKGWECKGKVIK